MRLAGKTILVRAAGQGIGILFGRERTGLENDEISLADAIVTFPVDPRHASLNLAQAVLLVAYEWRRASTGIVLPFGGDGRSPPAGRASLLALFDHLEGLLEELGTTVGDRHRHDRPAAGAGVVRRLLTCHLGSSRGSCARRRRRIRR